MSNSTDISELVSAVDGTIEDLASDAATAIRNLLTGQIADEIDGILSTIVESVDSDGDGEADQYGEDNHVPDDEADEDTNDAAKQALIDAYAAGVERTLALLQEHVDAAKYRG